MIEGLTNVRCQKYAHTLNKYYFIIMKKKQDMFDDVSENVLVSGVNRRRGGRLSCSRCGRCGIISF